MIRNKIVGTKTLPVGTICLTDWVSHTRAELLIDYAPDLLELVEVRGLQEWKEIPHVGLLPGHGDVSAGVVWWGFGGVRVEAVPFPPCLEHPWGRPPLVSRHLCVTTAPLLFTFSQKGGSRVRINGHMTTPTTHGRTGLHDRGSSFHRTVIEVSGSKLKTINRRRIWC